MSRAARRSTTIFDRITPKVMIGGLVLLLVATALIVLWPSASTKTATLHFSRTVSIYPGSEVRVMGVKIGQVDAVVPEGESVRLEVSYDSAYDLPADAKAAIVTPTLVADRFVQIFPVYEKGAKLEEGGDIPLSRTNTPIELDRMYAALDDVSVALGPQPGQASGPLNNVLQAGAKALEGNGELGGEAIRNLSAAVTTFSDNRGPLFENVQHLASLSQTLAENDALVNDFITNLSGVSGQLSGERRQLRRVVVALARMLGTVRGFVKENRRVLTKDVKLLRDLMGTIEQEKDALAVVVGQGPLAMGNLMVAFDPSTGTFGSRINFAPTFDDPARFLCDTIRNNAIVKAPGEVCTLLDTVLGPLTGVAQGGGARQGAREGARGGAGALTGARTGASSAPVGDDLTSLLGQPQGGAR